MPVEINSSLTSETRNAMTKFWKDHSRDGSEVEMMLDTNAEQIGRHDIPEVMTLLPSMQGSDVVELGAGIGRFTSEVAKTAKSVLAVDFIEKFVAKNRETNKKLANVTFQQADVTELQLPEESADLVFSNWLMMYLTDEEVHKLLCKALHWMRDGGYLFVRESCRYQSGNKKREENPTIYRDPAKYNALFQSASIAGPGGQGSYAFDLVLSRPMQTYIKLKKNKNQICWLMQKAYRQEAGKHGYHNFQEFLDKQQYSRTGILRYERVFGRTYVSTGGKETTEEFVKLLDLQPGQRVLDVGCGIGGGAFYMAKHFGVDVVGIDLSSNMIDIAQERLEEEADVSEQVEFEVADATKRRYPEASFDVVYSRDTILHIEDKKALFSSFLKWLKPGGKLLISDYCCKEGEHSEAFQKYVAQRGYILLSPSKYGQVLEEVGFVNVKAEDRTYQFIDVLQRELARTESMEESFLQEFSKEDYDTIISGWKDKLKRCGLGDQRWGLFYAEKK